jgi:hypothetical protein
MLAAIDADDANLKKRDCKPASQTGNHLILFGQGLAAFIAQIRGSFK